MIFLAVKYDLRNQAELKDCIQSEVQSLFSCIHESKCLRVEMLEELYTIYDRLIEVISKTQSTCTFNILPFTEPSQVISSSLK